MAQTEPRPLAEVLFGPPGTAPRPEVDLAEVLQAWVRTVRARGREAASTFRPHGQKAEGRRQKAESRNKAPLPTSDL
jgi:hypothetical protein